METYAEIKLTFSDDLSAGVIEIPYGSTGNWQLIKEEFVLVRTEPGLITSPSATANPGYASAMAFLDAFTLDYNLTGLFVTEINGNEVIIKSANYDVYFDDAEAELPEDVSLDYTPRGVQFALDNITFSEADSEKCSKIKVSIETTEQADEMIYPTAINPVSSNPIVLTLNRNVSYLLQLRKGTTYINGSFVMPGLLVSSAFTLVTDNNPGGSMLTVNGSVQGLSLQYSLDDSSWQSSNIFSGLSGGNYTLYIRDQYGCKITKEFELTYFGFKEAYFYYSKSNSVRMANRVTHGDCGNYKNDENTLSCEVDVLLPYKTIQLFQSCDKFKVQFKSNYDDHVASVTGDDSSPSIMFPIVKLTDNMNKTDRRDASVFTKLITNGIAKFQTRIFFTSGNVYNFDTGATTGNYTLNGNLPEWGKPGNWVKIGVSGSWLLIQDVVFDIDKSAWCLIVNGYPQINPVGTVETHQVFCYYDLQNYEVYEYEIDMFDFLDRQFQIDLYATSSQFPTVVMKSELIHVKVRWKDTLEIRYKNRLNTDVLYATGIEHKIRKPITKINGFVDDETETHKTDTDVLLLSTELHEGNEFIFEPMTREMMIQLVQALSHSNVYIDNVAYTKSSIEIEGSLEESNLYVVTARMLKTRGAFAESSDVFNTGNMEIPALIDMDGGFVKYQ